jgi:hypothetical protein
MENSQQLHTSDIKKTWTAPDLIILDVKSTMATGNNWQFLQEGDFWKRELLDS